jgi:predicted class III extradiol MEMO1 family dioxygenase
MTDIESVILGKAARPAVDAGNLSTRNRVLYYLLPHKFYYYSTLVYCYFYYSLPNFIKINF